MAKLEKTNEVTPHIKHFENVKTKKITLWKYHFCYKFAILYNHELLKSTEATALKKDDVTNGDGDAFRGIVCDCESNREKQALPQL